MSKKVNVFIFQNGENRIYLPYSVGAYKLTDVCISLAKKLSPDKNLTNFRMVKLPGNAIAVDREFADGFSIDGNRYRYGDVYRRLS